MRIEVEVAIYNVSTGKEKWHTVICQSRETIDADVEQWCMENLECDFDVMEIVVIEKARLTCSKSAKC